MSQPEKQDLSLRVTVNKNPVTPPLLDTKEASSIEIRDHDGNLMILIIMVPGHPVLFKSAADQDEDFESFCANMGFALRK